MPSRAVRSASASSSAAARAASAAGLRRPRRCRPRPDRQRVEHDPAQRRGEGPARRLGPARRALRSSSVARSGRPCHSAASAAGLPDEQDDLLVDRVESRSSASGARPARTARGRPPAACRPRRAGWRPRPTPTRRRSRPRPRRSPSRRAGTGPRRGDPQVEPSPLQVRPVAGGARLALGELVAASVQPAGVQQRTSRPRSRPAVPPTGCRSCGPAAWPGPAGPGPPASPVNSSCRGHVVRA
jgi:hypothetical protein